jgi:hypothetical protein
VAGSWQKKDRDSIEEFNLRSAKCVIEKDWRGVNTETLYVATTLVLWRYVMRASAIYCSKLNQKFIGETRTEFGFDFIFQFVNLSSSDFSLL